MKIDEEIYKKVVSLLTKVKCGRPRISNKKLKDLVLELYWKRNLSLRKIARISGLSVMTVWREVNESSIPDEAMKLLTTVKGEIYE